MSKRKILSTALVLCMVAILAVGGTLAYFTDTDEATNTFTIGKVDITLVEDFGDNDPETDEKLLPGKENAVKKEVKITLDKDSEDAYVWYEYLIPTELDSINGSTGTDNDVHVNAYGYTWDTYRENKKYWPEGRTEALPLDQTWDHDANVELSTLVGPEGYIGTETIDNIQYNKYVVLYHGVVAAKGETTPAMSQVYLDAGIDSKVVDGKTVFYDKNGDPINFDLSNINIIVRAYGIQAEGIKDVYAAYAAYNAQAPKA